MTPPPDIPMMVAPQDAALIAQLAEGLPAGAVAVEFGPWLGALSVRIAPHAALHVVDCFRWTADHDRRVPGLCAVGESFRPALEANLTARGLSATLHEADFAAFTWAGPEVALCVIDGPKTPEGLLPILTAMAGALTGDSRIVIKNGLNPSYPQLVLMQRALTEAGALVDAPMAGQGNILVARPGPEFGRAAEIWAAAQARSATSAEGGTTYQLAALLQHLREGAWVAAYDTLSGMAPDPALIKRWDKLAERLGPSVRHEGPFAVFAEMFAFHHGSAGIVPGSVNPGRSAVHLRRAWWVNAADKPWRGRAFHPDILTRLFDFGYAGWPARIQDLLRGRDVLDVGCGPGLHGIGYLAAGAKSHLGVDPIIKPERDLVKNLTAKRKEPFGWTPRELDALIEPWRVTPQAVDDLPDERGFDLAVLHNATEHLMHLDEVFRAIAARLREGGLLHFSHHNFYCWNGHHQQPKTVTEIVPGDPEQAPFLDWGHLSYDAPEDHYTRRKLNRIRLDEIVAATERYFDVVTVEDIPSKPDQGAGRLTDAIRARHRDLTERDFLTQNLRVVARVRL